MNSGRAIHKVFHAVFGVESGRDVLRLVPGVTLAALLMWVALPLSRVAGSWVVRLQGLDPGTAASPISGVLIAILCGLLIRNTVGLPDVFSTGVRFSVAKILRLGIIFIGIKLSVFDVLKLGAWGIPVVVAAIATGLVFVTWFNRLLGLPDRLGTLIAAGTGICGVTAIVSTAPAIDAEEREVAYAIANITLFGLIGMFCYPYLAPLILSTPEQIGLFLGTAIHDTSQVVGSALTYKEIHADDAAFKAATVTKLTRNLFLAAVVPLLAFYYARRRAGDTVSGHRVDARKFFPAFIVGFVAMAAVRSIGDALVASNASAFLDDGSWKSITRHVGEVWGARYLLGTAMAAVGLGTSFSVFRGVGLRPFAVGLVGAILVGVVGLAMALVFGRFVHL